MMKMYLSGHKEKIEKAVQYLNTCTCVQHDVNPVKKEKATEKKCSEKETRHPGKDQSSHHAGWKFLKLSVTCHGWVRSGRRRGAERFTAHLRPFETRLGIRAVGRCLGQLKLAVAGVSQFRCDRAFRCHRVRQSFWR